MDYHINREIDIYANLGVSARIWLNKGGEKNATARKALLSVWDRMAFRDCFDTVLLLALIPMAVHAVRILLLIVIKLCLKNMIRVKNQWLVKLK
jgi:hypothetical protein